MYRSVETVREGKGLSVSLQATKVFPELAIEMIEVGESTGALPQMLNSVAEFFEEDVQTNLTAAMSLIEPLILIMMGLVVTTILIALYLPIFSLSAGGSGRAVGNGGDSLLRMLACCRWSSRVWRGAAWPRSEEGVWLRKLQCMESRSERVRGRLPWVAEGVASGSAS